jgi:3-hydroxyisobutyrate dehydrogenase-like beta-hydroxyacid dehydrogenase
MDEHGHQLPVAVIGFGELGSVLAEGLSAAGVRTIRAYHRPGPRAGEVAGRIRAAGARPCTALPEALGGAGVVVSAVPASAAAEVAAASAELLEPGTLYADLSAGEPERKAAAAALVGRGGGRYADVAVMGTVVTSGYGVPMLASGPGAAAWEGFARACGMTVDVIAGPVGQASAIKLLRSVYMKGRDALVTEAVLAARRYGVERELLSTIAGPGEEVSFPELAERVLCALAVHAERRADELAGSAALLRAAGVEPLMTDAASLRLRWVADLGLRERFSGRRPDGLGAVLEAIDELSPPPEDTTAWAASRASC